MFGELPKLFDRNFAVGFFLPVTLFITISGILLSRYGFTSQLVAYLTTDLLIGTTVTGLLAWIGGIVLLAFNRALYRILEGYGDYNPLKLLIGFERKRFADLEKELKRVNNEGRKFREQKKEIPASIWQRRDKLLERRAVEFPDKEEYLLATPFGNILRSFEVYSRVMYGLEAIYAWERLLAVIPKDYLDLIDAAKARVDLWVNLAFIFLILQVEYVALASVFGNPMSIWIVLLFISLGTLALLGATSAAKGWGSFVKSAFDMFAPKMRETLGFDPPANRAEEMQQWTSFSQAIIYRLPKQMPESKSQTKETDTVRVYHSSSGNSYPRRPSRRRLRRLASK
jgi:hypothetical protein